MRRRGWPRPMGVQAARAYVVDVVADRWGTCCRGDPPSMKQRARMLLAGNQRCVRRWRRSTRSPLVGAKAVFAGQPPKRCVRAIHTANQHILFSANRDKACATLPFGIDQATFMT
jgi:indole-3-acetate monooxygenase